MTAGAGEPGRVLQHFAGGQRSGIGHFRAVSDSGWWWADEVYEIFGLPAGSVNPSWELIRAHIIEDDRATADAQCAQAFRHVGAFSWSHRICAADGVLRSLLVVGDSHVLGDAPDDDIRAALQMSGYVIDLTDLRLQAARSAATEAVVRSAEHRAEIEQAKGILMFAYQVDADAAFALLVWHSQHSNRKLSSIAASVVTSVSSQALASSDLRTALDRIMAGLCEQPTNR